jgi:phage-related protein
MTLIASIQTLEPGSEIILFDLDGSDYGAGTIYFHGHSIQSLAGANGWHRG